MNLWICGIIDIIIIVALIIVGIVGYKKGFLKKAIGLVSLVFALIVAFTFCTQLAELFKNNDIIYPNIFDSVLNNIQSSDAYQNSDQSVVGILQSINVPKFIAEIIASNIVESAEDIAFNISTTITDVAIKAVAFLILFVGVFIIAFILKILTSLLRNVPAVKVIDGIFGIVLYLSLTICVIYVLFTILAYMMDASWFSGAKEFFVVDMQLDNNNFRISKWIYENNVIYGILNLLF